MMQERDIFGTVQNFLDNRASTYSWSASDIRALVGMFRLMAILDALVMKGCWLRLMSTPHHKLAEYSTNIRNTNKVNQRESSHSS